MEYYKKCIEIRDQLNDESGKARTYLNMSVVYKNKKNYEKTLFYANKSLEISKKLDYKKVVASAYANIAQAYYHLKDYKSALTYNKKALDINKEIGYKQGICWRQLSYGEIYLALGNYKKAEEHLFVALNISKEMENKEDILETWMLLSKLYSKRGNYKKAYEYKKSYNKLKDSLFTEEKNKSIVEMQTRFDVEKKEQEIALLKKDQEVKDLELEKSRFQISNQKTIRNFSIAIFLISVFIFYLLFHRYKANQKRTKLELEKHSAETENRLLRSQMNPHFIFNSLYSIQGFVANNKSKIAESYLADFATLMRAILNNSSQSFVTLDKELESLRLYVKLEQLRFDGKFDFKFIVDEKVEQEFILVPPMLLQPFVENSILHGILPKKEEGSITVDIKEHENSLLCCIIDDGIGRDESKKRNDIRKKEHRSIALDVTQNRLALLGSELGVNTYLKIIDLKDENNKPTGTKVEILVPIKEI